MFNIRRFMKKQTIDLEQDMKQAETTQETPEQPNTEATADKVADDKTTEADNVSVEPTLEEQIAAWRDKYLRLLAEFDNFR